MIFFSALFKTRIEIPESWNQRKLNVQHTHRNFISQLVLTISAFHLEKSLFLQTDPFVWFTLTHRCYTWPGTLILWPLTLQIKAEEYTKPSCHSKSWTRSETAWFESIEVSVQIREQTGGVQDLTHSCEHYGGERYTYFPKFSSLVCFNIVKGECLFWKPRLQPEGFLPV